MDASSPDLGVVSVLRSAGCVFAEQEAVLLAEAATSPAELAAMLSRRAGGEPLEQVLGWAEFCGLRVAVVPGVFVPRQRTALLVELAARRARPGSVVVDLCCGTGAIGAAIAAAVLGVELHAADLDPRAAACARRNLVTGEVHEGDLYAALPARLRGAVDVLVVNAPYVPTDEIPLMPVESRDHEDSLALDGGPGGLDVQRRVASGALSWLGPQGVLLVETSRRQAAGTVGLCAAAGLDATVVRRKGAVAVRAVPSR